MGTPTSGPLAGVRDAARAVAGRARLVRVNEGRVADYAASLPLEQAARPRHDAAMHFLGHGDATVAFFLTLDAINFGSGYFPHLRKLPGRSGYGTVASHLTRRFAEQGPLPAETLARLSPDACLALFDQDPQNAVARELMGFFAKALNDLGRWLLDQFDGSFVAAVEAAGHSAERLVALLTEMPFFNDVERYGGLDVPFYKRAQLTAADLAIAFDGQGPGRLDDLDRLTIFADNLVPHVLRVDGILAYDADLAAGIDAEQLLPAGSPEEVEIRACAVHAVELMADALRQSGRPVTPAGLDYLLWNRGQAPHYKARPRHRTRTVFY